MAYQGTPRLAALAPVLASLPRGPVVVDCSNVSRFGLRGKGSYEWLQSHGVSVSNRINMATVAADGMLTLRLGQNDIAISGNSDGSAGVASTESAWRKAEGRNGYDGFRRDTWAHLLISGQKAADLMAELTDVDLREQSLPVCAIAQTRVLHVDTIIARTDPAGVPGYELFFDLASRSFMLESLHHLAPGYDSAAH
jgi:sarcosine oxidase, subunit gamma